jgi:hypothetical protein
MDTDDERDTIETGSDELLSEDSLRLPDAANPLVRLHAMRAWLTRKQKEATLEMGEAALELQQLQYEDSDAPRLRRREREERTQRVQQAQDSLQRAQAHLSAYEEAEATLEDCVNHLTVGERLLVEYYLILEDTIQTSIQDDQESASSPRIEALLDVQQRVERIGSPQDD